MKHHIRLRRMRRIHPFSRFFLSWMSFILIFFGTTTIFSSTIYNNNNMNVYNNSNDSVTVVAFTTNTAIRRSLLTNPSTHSYNANNNSNHNKYHFLWKPLSSTNSPMASTRDVEPLLLLSDRNTNILNHHTNFIVGTDPTTKPNYDTMIGPFGKWLDEFCLTLFRNQLRDEVLRSYSNTDDDDVDVDTTRLKNHHQSDRQQQQQQLRADPMYYGKANYTQIVALAAAMNARYSNTNNKNQSNSPMIQQSAQNVLIALFPKWLPKWYQILFAKPFPIFSAKMNAYVTAALGVWLMGECTINDISIPTTAITKNASLPLSSSSSSSVTGINQGVLVTRCRFLEESQCASICIHSCKIPTQKFFLQQMGVPLLMEPNYTTGSCQFSFGRYPNTTTETTMIQTPCLSRCPTSGSYRPNHSNIQNVHTNNTIRGTSMCSMIEDTAMLS